MQSSKVFFLQFASGTFCIYVLRCHSEVHILGIVCIALNFSVSMTANFPWSLQTLSLLLTLLWLSILEILFAILAVHFFSSDRGNEWRIVNANIFATLFFSSRRCVKKLTSSFQPEYIHAHTDDEIMMRWINLAIVDDEYYAPVITYYVMLILNFYNTVVWLILLVLSSWWFMGTIMQY